MNELELIEEELLTVTNGNNLVFGVTSTNNNDAKYKKINVRIEVNIFIFYLNKNINIFSNLTSYL